MKAIATTLVLASLAGLAVLSLSGDAAARGRKTTLAPDATSSDADATGGCASSATAEGPRPSRCDWTTSTR